MDTTGRKRDCSRAEEVYTVHHNNKLAGEQTVQTESLPEEIYPETAQPNDKQHKKRFENKAPQSIQTKKQKDHLVVKLDEPFLKSRKAIRNTIGDNTVQHPPQKNNVQQTCRELDDWAPYKQDIS